LTLFGALTYVGTVLSRLLGTLGDRVGLRRVLAGMRISYALLAAVILALFVGGRLSPSGVLAVAFLVGLIKPSDIGLRTALVSATMPAVQLVAAMGLARSTQDSARIGGAPAGAGFMASLGMASACGAIIALYLTGMVLTLRSGGGRSEAGGAHAATGAQDDPAPPPRSASPWRDLQEGLQHVWQTPRLLAAMSLAALVNLCAYPLRGRPMPCIARGVFGLDPQGVGVSIA